MSVYKRKDSPYYYYRFEMLGRPFHGSTSCTSRRDAEAVEKTEREKAAAETKRVGLSERPTVDEVFARYWEVEGHKKAQANYNVRDHLTAALVIWGGERLYDTLTSKDVANVLEKYEATGVAGATVTMIPRSGAGNFGFGGGGGARPAAPGVATGLGGVTARAAADVSAARRSESASAAALAFA